MPTRLWLLYTSPKAEKQLDNLPRKQAAAIREAIDELLIATNPTAVHGVLKVQNSVNAWRIRQGDYRTLFTLDTNPVTTENHDYKGILVVSAVLKRDEGTYR